MHKKPSKTIWRGQIDDKKDKNSFRWHQNKVLTPNKNGISLLGFECDTGLERSKGRLGSKTAPNKLKKALANLPSHSQLQQKIFDAGNIVCLNNKMEAAQIELSSLTTDLLGKTGLHINLGGSQEIAFASFNGLANFIENTEKRPNIGIIKFGSEFGIKQKKLADSQTPFAQIADLYGNRDWDFNFMALGISELKNTKATFLRAKVLNMQHRLDRNCSLQHLVKATKQLDDFMAKIDHLYLSINLNAFSPTVAPGVSNPATNGMTLNIAEPLLRCIARSGKLKLVDIADYNTKYDKDEQTARLVALLIFTLTR